MKKKLSAALALMITLLLAAAAVQAEDAIYEAPIMQTIRAFEESTGEQVIFPKWSYENKARWTAEMKPVIVKYLEEHPDATMQDIGMYNMHAARHFTYGLPDDKAITQERAIQLSRAALRSAYQLSGEELSLLIDNGIQYSTEVYYDVTDPAKPLWKFRFTMPTIYDADEAIVARVKGVYGKRDDYDLFYKAEVNAYTGEIVRTLKWAYAPSTPEEYIDIM